MTAAAAEQVTDAVVAAIEANEHPVGDHRAPEDTSGRYTIVTNLPGGTFDGSQADDHQMATLLFQVDSFGRSRQQCQHLADLNRRLMRGTITPAGWAVMYVGSLGPGGVEDEGNDTVDGNPTPLFCSRETFLVQITPA